MMKKIKLKIMGFLRKTRIRHFLRLSYKTCKWVLLLAAFFILFALGFWIYNWLRFRG